MNGSGGMGGAATGGERARRIWSRCLARSLPVAARLRTRHRH
ncbi:hypothetical protein FTUN_1235 [Frigoriglobus tundricola]|uniref:Uncharacterized protein n=1 Tax=Frigoriglobus tundricola TaxID=2774151 RepID=A0A6M5YJJ6_9BACT|nr:hypothetical protein FTUN_1235 [Frigoriglobus tundricola]